MIVLNKESIFNKIVLTLADSIKLEEPFFLLIFSNDTTGNLYSFILNAEDDESNNKTRYNAFTITGLELLKDMAPGDYKYKVYEQDNETNIDPAGLNLLEVGKMQLKGPALPFSENDNINITFYQNK